MGFLKPKTKLKATNLNQKLLTDKYSPQIDAGNSATNVLQSLLTGQGDTGAANAGYENYLQMAGYAPAMRQLSQNLTGQAAASGLLNSGSLAKSLQTRGTELNQGFYNNYLQNLSGLSGLGLQAGGLVANAGQGQLVTKPSTFGSIASAVGGIANTVKTVAPFFSDRRLKRDIVRVSEFSDGLGIYAYRHVMGIKRILGVMADEVERLRPWALGPKIAGYRTVNYGAL